MVGDEKMGGDERMGKRDPAFSLLTEPWIQVVMLDGSFEAIGLLRLFEDARFIRGIAGEMPQMQFVTLRLCEAILYRAFSAPGATETELLGMWEELFDAGRFPQEVLLGYLEGHRERFDLFGAHPFYQVAGLSYAAGTGPSRIGAIMPDVPLREDKTLFSMRSIRHASSLTFGEAARYLLMAQGYDASGIKTPVVGNTRINKGKVYPPKGLPGTGWCGSIGGTYLEGRNLFETLMLNWVLFDDRAGSQGVFGIEGDVPPWERNDIGPDMKECEPVGPVQILTWQSRRVRLVPDESGTCVQGVVICYGDTMRPIDKQGIEMMTPWRRSEAQQRRWSLPYVPWMARGHDPKRSIWRGLASLLAFDGAAAEGQPDLRPGVVRWAELLESKGFITREYGLAIRTQGMEYGTQSCVISDSIDDAISLHAIMLRHDGEAMRKMLEVIALADKAVGNLIGFVQRVSTAQGDKQRHGSAGDAAVDALRQDVAARAYDELDGLFRSRIACFDESCDVYAYCASWLRDAHRVLLDIAGDYLEESDVSLFTGGSMSAGRAFELLKTNLSGLLGPLSEQISSDSPAGDE